MAQQYEAKLVNEYLASDYLQKHYEVRQWLGVPPIKEFREASSVVNRWADAIVFEQHQVTIIEAKMRPDPKAIGQLKMYADLFKRTPRYSRYEKLPVYMVFLTTAEDDGVRALCEREGIEYRIYRPKWIEDWEAVKFRLKPRI